MLLEVETVYLKGDFSVENRNGKWVICAPEVLTYGSWKEHGAPFYPGAALYSYDLSLDKKPAAAEIDLSYCGATALSLEVNGRYAGLIHADGKRAKDISEYLKEGDNSLKIRLSGSFKNLLGPHFVRARGWAGPGLWRAYPEHAPAAEEYDLLDYGLLGDVTVTVD